MILSPDWTTPECKTIPIIPKNYSSFVIVSNHRLQKPRFECIDLSTRISQSGDFDQSVMADLESGTSGQG